MSAVHTIMVVSLPRSCSPRVAPKNRGGQAGMAPARKRARLAPALGKPGWAFEVRRGIGALKDITSTSTNRSSRTSQGDAETNASG
jgi:hypothetical protein